jgi:hypothetical protein
MEKTVREDLRVEINQQQKKKLKFFTEGIETGVEINQQQKNKLKFFTKGMKTGVEINQQQKIKLESKSINNKKN